MDSSDKEGEEYLFKVAIIGDSAVRKSNLLCCYSLNMEFNMHSKATIGVEFQTQNMEFQGKEVKAQIWDTAGEERFHAVTSLPTIVALLVLSLFNYDITRRTTFDSVTRWLQELIRTNNSDTPQQCWLETKEYPTLEMLVWKKLGVKLVEKQGLFFIETSALDSVNVKKAFETVIRESFLLFKMIQLLSLIERITDNTLLIEKKKLCKNMWTE